MQNIILYICLMAFTFEHQADYDTLLPEICPPKDYVAKDINPVYRWVFDPVAQRRNFISQYHKNPKRSTWKDPNKKCEGLALSLFDSLEGCKARFEELKSGFTGENVYFILGTHIAKGSISEKDGVNQSEPDKFGHFNHHPIDSNRYEAVFKIILSL